MVFTEDVHRQGAVGFIECRSLLQVIKPHPCGVIIRTNVMYALTANTSSLARGGQSSINALAAGTMIHRHDMCCSKCPSRYEE